MNNKEKIIFITAFHSLISKNLLNSDVFKILKNNTSRLVLLVPKEKEAFFKENFEFDNIVVESINIRKILSTFWAKLFHRIAYSFFDSHYLWYKKIERYNKNKSFLGLIKFQTEIISTKLFSNRKSIVYLIRRFFLKFLKFNDIERLFLKYNPDILFSTDLFDEADLLFAASSKRFGIKTISMVRSWDNCWSKGILRVVPDIFIVNNEGIKKELLDMHYLSGERIFIGGLPQFDNFINTKRIDKHIFLERTGLKENKKIILFAPAGSVLSNTDYQICEIIKEAKEKNKIKFPIQILVRNHPAHPAIFSNFKNNGDFVFDKPWENYGEQNGLKCIEFTKGDTEHLANSLYHSDLVIWVATSLGLDATVFNKPQIVINFDGLQNEEYHKSVKKYHDEDHMKKMLTCGGMRVVDSPEKLIESINLYLDNSSLDQNGRDRVSEQQLYRLDGRSGERIANFILEELKDTNKN